MEKSESELLNWFKTGYGSKYVNSQAHFNFSAEIAEVTFMRLKS